VVACSFTSSSIRASDRLLLRQQQLEQQKLLHWSRVMPVHSLTAAANSIYVRQGPFYKESSRAMMVSCLWHVFRLHVLVAYVTPAIAKISTGQAPLLSLCLETCE
jgi:hypothetical protein